MAKISTSNKAKKLIISLSSIIMLCRHYSPLLFCRHYHTFLQFRHRSKNCVDILTIFDIVVQPGVLFCNANWKFFRQTEVSKIFSFFSREGGFSKKGCHLIQCLRTRVEDELTELQPSNVGFETFEFD